MSCSDVFLPVAYERAHRPQIQGALADKTDLRIVTARMAGKCMLDEACWQVYKILIRSLRPESLNTLSCKMPKP